MKFVSDIKYEFWIVKLFCFQKVNKKIKQIQENK